MAGKKMSLNLPAGVKCYPDLRKAAWLKRRKKVITASDFAALVDCHPYRSRRGIWEEKIGLSPPQTETPAMTAGKEAEAEIISEVKALAGTQANLTPSLKTLTPHQSYYENLDWRLGATLDAMTEDGIVVDIKNVSEQGLAKNWDSTFTKIPLIYQFQLAIQMGLTGAKVALLLVRLNYHDGKKEYHSLLHEHDDLVFKDLRAKALEFWTSIEKKIAPQAAELKDGEVADWLKAHAQDDLIDAGLKLKETDNAIGDLLTSYQEQTKAMKFARDEVNEMKRMMDRTKLSIIQLLKKHRTGSYRDLAIKVGQTSMPEKTIAPYKYLRLSVKNAKPKETVYERP